MWIPNDVLLQGLGMQPSSGNKASGSNSRTVARLVEAPVVGLLVSLILFHGGLNLRLAGRELQRSVVQLVVARLLLVLPMLAAQKRG